MKEVFSLSSKIRFMQAADCCLDGWCSNRPLWKHCSSNSCSQYYDIDYGSHSIIICHSDNHCPSYNSYAYLPENSFNTLVASGSDRINLFVTPDGLKVPCGTNKAYIRFINLAYDEPCLDFRFSDGVLAIARNIKYQETTNYYPITASTYTMQVFRCGGSKPLLYTKSVTLKPDQSYTFYITVCIVNRSCYNYLLCVDACPKPICPPCPPPNPCVPIHSCHSCPPLNPCPPSYPCPLPGKNDYCSNSFYYNDCYYY